ncbi:MAG: class I SAM-dependent methyltransferase [Chloroflexota bacterium]|nr:MAG: class I SAM-dependent methyltransferase [Chloroflexota bacterium]
MQDALENYLYPVRDRILNQANLAGNETLLDVGCGDGLVAFGALEKFPYSQVIFSDISEDLLSVCHSIAAEMGVSERCRFVRLAADDLNAIGDESVDVVTTRAVLIYVKPKQRAFGEFYRVLKPGGRISIFEPINRFGFPSPPNQLAGYDLSAVPDLIRKVRAVFSRFQGEDNPMVDFDERDLLVLAEESGFKEIHMKYWADIQADPRIYDWESFLKTAPNPLVPTLEEAVSQALTPEEAERFIACLRPLVENTRPVTRMAHAHLWAIKQS